MNKQSKILVGTGWNQCPCCHASYHSDDTHHPACPVAMTTSLCHYCGAAYSQDHAPGCPNITGLFPVLYSETRGSLECGSCQETLILGDCFVVGRVAILCLGCAWEESAEEFTREDDEPDA